jgi:hypothetical protein
MNITVDNLVYLYGKKQLEVELLNEQVKLLQAKVNSLLADQTAKQEEVK